MGIRNLFKKTQEIRAEANSEKEKEIVKKDIEKTKKQFESKRDKEIQKYKTTEAHQLNYKSSEFKAYVVLNLVNGVISEEIAVLGAEIGHKDEQPTLKVKDREGNIIFEEIKPDAIDEIDYIDKDTIEKKLTDCTEALKKIQSGEKKSINNLYERDWLQKYRYWSSKKTHMLLGEKGSYMKIRGGVPHYEFDLVGYFKIPTFRYTSKSTVAIPPLGKIITGQVLLKKIYDEINAPSKDAQKLMNTIYGMLIAICLFGSLFLMYHSGQTDAEISANFKDATQSLSSLINQSEKLSAIENSVTNISNSLYQNVSLDEPTKNLGKVVN